MAFQERLKQLNIDPSYYLTQARAQAKKYGFNYKTIDFSNTKNKKLRILDDNNKVVNFGSSINNDYIIWKTLEHRKEVEKGYAHKKQKVFWTSHTAMKYDKENKYSANNLALFILW